MRELAATLSLPLASFSEWLREARPWARSLLESRGGLQPLDLGLRPSSSCWWAPSGPCASLNLRLPFPQLRPGSHAEARQEAGGPAPPVAEIAEGRAAVPVAPWRPRIR